ncbi:MAG: hypothetical protein EAY66_01455 [Sphingobacteriales bacterium]|nr:MAG: hypothetical protein EAY66_01455 [Sphingobacteriales bacterium]
MHVFRRSINKAVFILSKFLKLGKDKKKVCSWVYSLALYGKFKIPKIKETIFILPLQKVIPYNVSRFIVTYIFYIIKPGLTHLRFW